MNNLESFTGGTTRLPNQGNLAYPQGVQRAKPQAGYKPLMWLTALLLAASVAGCSSSDSTTAAVTSPTVNTILPADAAIGVALNANITATFSGAMDPATITLTTFTLTKQGSTTAVLGALSFPSTTSVTFDPSSNLAAGAIYTGTITTGVKDAAGNAMAANKTWSFTTGAAADNTLPTVSSTVPADTTTGAVNASITATFLEGMDAATINTTTFTLMQGTTVVPGVVTYVGNIATFNPTGDLTPGLTYTATITTGAKDLSGNALAANITWTFTTGATADNTAPTVSSTDPLDAASAVAVTANITATFLETMDAATINSSTFTLKRGATVVPGVVTYAGNIATFNPTGNLLASTTLANTTYTATITTGAQDLAGKALAADKIWSFTTVVDNTAPTVTTIPASGVIDVAVNTNIVATFSEAMDAATLDTLTFTLQGASAVPGAVTSPSATTAIFNPDSDLAASAVYTATITTGAQDLAGNAMAATSWEFTTGAAGGAGPLPVDLGLAGNFAVLSKSGISTAGVTAGAQVTGDMGVSPIDSTAITGFGLALSNTFATSSLVTGNIYAADYTEPTPSNLTTAVSNMETAFTDAAGRTVPAAITELGAGNITGMNLAPGLYKWGTGLDIDAAGVTLTGNANDVWVFQVAQDLTVANGAIVTLGGSAQAKNIFWQVTGQAVLGTTVQFKGIILSQTLISLNTGAVLNGRALAQTAVTLELNALVTQP